MLSWSSPKIFRNAPRVGPSYLEPKVAATMRTKGAGRSIFSQVPTRAQPGKCFAFNPSLIPRAPSTKPVMYLALRSLFVMEQILVNSSAT